MVNIRLYNIKLSGLAVCASTPANDSTLKDGTNNPPLSKKATCLEEIERLK